jgi:hypothetical protein
MNESVAIDSILRNRTMPKAYYMVSQVLHEHAASLSAASHANRSSRLTKCAKDSGHVDAPLSARRIFWTARRVVGC